MKTHQPRRDYFIYMYPCGPFKCLFSDAQYHRTVEFSLKVESYQMATKNVSFHYYLIHITSNCANNTHFHSKIYYLALKLHVSQTTQLHVISGLTSSVQVKLLLSYVTAHVSIYTCKNVMRSHQGYSGDFYF